MKKIFIIRHANTKYNTGMRWQGRRDLELDENGRWMAKRLAYRMAWENVAKIVASPLKRAKQTAEEIAKVHGLEVETDERLIEADLSLFEGRTSEEVKKMYPEKLNEWKTNPYAEIEGLESFESVYRRAGEFLENLKLPENGDLVIVSHAVVIRALITRILNLPLTSYRNFFIGTASISTVLIVDDGFKLINLNDRGHLDGGFR